MRFHYQLGTREQRVAWGPSSWLGRVVTAIVAAGLLVVGFFFFTILLIVAAVALGVMAIRWWWLPTTVRPTTVRPTTVRRSESDEVIDVQSVVLHDDAEEPPAGTRP